MERATTKKVKMVILWYSFASRLAALPLNSTSMGPARSYPAWILWIVKVFLQLGLRTGCLQSWSNTRFARYLLKFRSICETPG